MLQHITAEDQIIPVRDLRQGISMANDISPTVRIAV
jgi:hypothetical protein